jgi:uncharacterized protein YndB with AHSA1/START domain
MVPPDAVYRAFLDSHAVAKWLPPGSMTGELHAFEPREGGRFSMSLTYPDSETTMRGKTSARTDRFEGRFARLVPNEQIVWAVVFDSDDPSFAGEMTITTTLASAGRGTEVTMRCDDVPPGVRLEDNEAGGRLTLDQLVAFLGG